MEKPNNISTIDIKKCTGCSACFSICPSKAIRMENDINGFSHPVVDSSKCVECGKCLDSCQCYEKESFAKEIRPFLGYSKSNNAINFSTSGGIFYTLACKILSEGGVVYGAAYSPYPFVRHIRVDNIVDLRSLQGTKYTWSNNEESYKLVTNDLQNGRRVLFSGTPCQINGIVFFCIANRISRERLITISTACLGNSSQQFFHEYIDSIDKNNSGTNYEFRKRIGNLQIETLQLNNGSEIIMSTPYGNSLYTRPFFRNLSFRESCYNCPAKCNNRADIIIGDYWGINEFDNANFAETPSLCLPLSTTGKELLLSVQTNDFVLKEERSVGRNNYLFTSVNKPNMYSSFRNDVEAHGFLNASKKYCKPTKRKRIKDYSKRTCSKTRVCILTQNDMSNYGNRFQNIALSRFLTKEFNLKVTTCWPCFGATAKNRLFYPIKKIYYFMCDIFKKRSKEWIKRKIGFKNFNKLIKKNHALLSPLKPFSFLNRSSDYFLLGSDQVWNDDFGFKPPLSNLSFCQPWKRLTYAVSCGKNISSFEKNFDKRELPFFVNVSVREKQLLTYIKDKTIHSPATSNIDPSFLLLAKDWNEIIDGKISKKAKALAQQDNLVVYWLGEQSMQEKNAIDSLASRNHLNVVYLRTNSRDTYKTFVDASPFDFIYLFKTSKFIISKSFHGVAMSLIYNKNFAAVVELEDGKILDDRISSLFQQLSISQCHIFDINNPSITPIPNWSEINKEIINERFNTIKLFDTIFSKDYKK